MIVTVVTPALNGMRWLPECIDSTQRQAGLDIEVEHVVVDGGSGDGTPQYAAPRGCTVLTREEPSIAYAINKGAFSGEIQAPPSWVNAPILASLGWNCVAPMSTFVSRSFFEELGGFDPAFAHAIDYEFFVRALKREPFARVARTLSAARRHTDAMSMDRNAAHLVELAAIEEQSGPRSRTRRTLYRYALKVWLNATNPKWSALKRVDAFRGPRSGDGAIGVGL